MNPSISNTVGTVMVLGANGRLGRAAVLAFAEAGWAVTAQLRRAPRAPLPAGVQRVQADALDVARLAHAAKGVQLIVNALNPDYTQWARLLPPITKAVIEVAEATGATLMLPGNVYNYGNQLPAVLQDETPFAATHPKAAQRIALEDALAQAARDRGVRSIVIRAGDFLGDTGTWFDLAMGKRLAVGKFVQMGPTDLPHAWAWLPDLARVFVAVAGRREQLAPFTTLNYAGITLTGAELQAASEAALGRPLRRSAFPWPLIRLAALVAPMPRALVDMRYLWQRPHRLDGQRLQALLGDVMPATPLAEVVRQCLAALPGAPAVAATPATPVTAAMPGTPTRPTSAGR